MLQSTASSDHGAKTALEKDIRVLSKRYKKKISSSESWSIFLGLKIDGAR
jgi:hypothetical protein